jgi:hypothetical protein
MKKEHETKLETTTMRMIRQMCGVLLRDKKTSSELRDRVGVETIGEVCRRSRLRCLGYVKRKGDDDLIRKCTELVVDGRRPRGRSSITWGDMVKDDMKRMHSSLNDVNDKVKWRRLIHGCSLADQGTS